MRQSSGPGAVLDGGRPRVAWVLAALLVATSGAWTLAGPAPAAPWPPGPAAQANAFRSKTIGTEPQRTAGAASTPSDGAAPTADLGVILLLILGLYTVATSIRLLSLLGRWVNESGRSDPGASPAPSSPRSQLQRRAP